MKGNSTKYHRPNKSGLTLAVSIFFLFTIMILSTAPSWACKGVTHPGYNTTMKMIDPYTGDLFATVTFGEIKEEGIVKMTKSTGNSKSPSPYKLQIEPAYYDIATTSDYSGEVKICVNHDAIGFGSTNKSTLRLSHFENGTWVKLDTTLERANDLICGKAPSLSKFVIFEDPRAKYGPAMFWYHHVARPGL
ncbi:MAG: hypothetical protein JSW20_11240 [Nitrospiraceae bacterium]|nr:MAG: hypothetical protein JSW20_11240 [Nitrospiraceae bacterium]